MPHSSRCLLSFLGSRSQRAHILLSQSPSAFSERQIPAFLLSARKKIPLGFQSCPWMCWQWVILLPAAAVEFLQPAPLTCPDHLRDPPSAGSQLQEGAGICSIRSPTGTARELLLWLSHPRVTDASPGFKKPQGFDCFIHDEGEGDNAGHACVRRWMRQSFFFLSFFLT